MAIRNTIPTDGGDTMQRLRDLRDELLSSGVNVKALSNVLLERLESDLERAKGSDRWLTVEFSRDSLDTTLWTLDALWKAALANYQAVDLMHDELERLFRAEA